MRTLLLALALTFMLTSVSSAQDTLLGYFNQYQQQTLTVEHPKAHEPVKVDELDLGPIPPYFAQKYLRGEDYARWALTWNAYQDEVANRASSTRLLFGQTTTTTNTTNGTVTNTVPRVWFQHQGAPGQMRYNPFVEPKR